MKKIGIILYLLLFVSFTIYAQVGINTTDPQEAALHVVGKVRVIDTDTLGRTVTSVIGVDNLGVLSKIYLSPDFVINNNTISSSGTTSYSVIDIDFTDPDDVALYLEDYVAGVDLADLDLGLDGINAHETVVRFANAPQAFYISGIDGGVPGRHILFLNSSLNIQMGVRDQIHGGNASANENRILTYAPGTTDFTTGQGAIELVYDGTRWVVLNLRE